MFSSNDKNALRFYFFNKVAWGLFEVLHSAEFVSSALEQDILQKLRPLFIFILNSYVNRSSFSVQQSYS
jgi:hypothetical protein